MLDTSDDESVTYSYETSKIHLEYDPASLPPKPPEGDWTRFVCISDNHAVAFEVPEGDVLLHSGDLTGTGTVRGFESTSKWLYSLPHPIKIIIAGNHDLTLHEDWYEKQYSRWHRQKHPIEPIREMLKGPKAIEAGIVYLQDEKYEFQTKEGGRSWSIYGSPWSPYFCGWAFNYDRGLAAKNLLEKFPKTDILLTHGPPRDILDTVVHANEHAGCEALAARLPELKPRLHVFGHIHEAHGMEFREWPESDGRKDTTVFVNAANHPVARKAKRSTFGGPGFRPVVVDLLD